MFQQKDIALHEYQWAEEGQKYTLYLNQGYWTLKQTKKKRKMSKQKQTKKTTQASIKTVKWRYQEEEEEKKK